MEVSLVQMALVIQKIDDMQCSLANGNRSHLFTVRSSKTGTMSHSHLY